MSVLGMSRTIMRNLFSPPATRLYPTREKEPHRAARSRGRIEIDIEACIFCSACAKRCPTDAIIVLKSDKEWNIDRLRCCTCNACVEVCPKKCLSMGNRYTPPTVTRDKDIFRQPPKLTKEPETLPGA
ncbi:MAG: 4Fe-4S binding protein [Spirochaetia bacterium]|jgi:formate hydrogenlyase subunit 6/NADH:ubiquinone oxidoreductase subunit I